MVNEQFELLKTLRKTPNEKQLNVSKEEFPPFEFLQPHFLSDFKLQ